MKGRGVAAVHCVGDHLWLLGDGRIPDTPPASAAQAVEEHARRAREAAQAAREALALAEQRASDEARAQRLDELPKAIRRKEKALRQITDLQAQVDTGEVVLDDDQHAKLARAPALRDEIQAMQDELAALNLTLDATSGAVEEGRSDGSGGDGDGDGDGADEGAAAEDGLDGEPSEEADGDSDAPAAIGMDEALTQALLVALHSSITDATLPLLVSSLWGQHLAPAAARLAAPIENGSLEVKGTSWKKLAVFLGDMQGRGLVALDEPKKGVQILARVNRAHDLYTAFSVHEHVTDDAKAGVQGAAAKGKGKPVWAVPKKGSKVILIKLTKRYARVSLELVVRG
jgi:hypothetical protein